MRTPAEHISVLERRLGYLKLREHQNSYDLAEIGTLEWALVNLQHKWKNLTDDEEMDIALQPNKSRHWVVCEAIRQFKEKNK